LTLFRILAIAIALVVPVQGMATVMAGLCMGAGHHQDAGARGHAAHGGDGSDHGAHSHDEHGLNAEAGDDGKTAHCAPCAACCASASIAGTTGVWIVSLPSSAAYVFSQSPPPSVLLDELDRPPLAL
jgi:hypothetical protein